MNYEHLLNKQEWELAPILAAMTPKDLAEIVVGMTWNLRNFELLGAKELGQRVLRFEGETV